MLYNIVDHHGNIHANQKLFTSKEEALSYIEEQEALDIGIQYSIVPAFKTLIQSVQRHTRHTRLYALPSKQYELEYSSDVIKESWTFNHLKDALNSFNTITQGE